jgi:hypothetical protein
MTNDEDEMRIEGYEVLKAVVMKLYFWDITQCSPLKVDVSEEHVASIFRVEV